MAELVITEATVAMAGSGFATANIEAGEAFTRMMPLYRNTSDNKYYKCLNDTEANALCTVISLTPSSADGDWAVAIKSGPMVVGASVNIIAGQYYCVAPTAGKIYLASELSTLDFVTYLGYGLNTTDMQIDINATAIQSP